MLVHICAKFVTMKCQSIYVVDCSVKLPTQQRHTYLHNSIIYIATLHLIIQQPYTYVQSNITLIYVYGSITHPYTAAVHVQQRNT